MHKRNGKVAHLPKDLREIVNVMLEDGAQYESIIRELEKHRHRWPDDIENFTEGNISQWHSGGYVDWMREQQIQSDLEARHTYASALAEHTTDNKLNEVVVQIGVNHLYHFLASVDRIAYQAKFIDDPAVFCRVVNTLSRLSRTAFDMQKYKDHVRERKERIDAELNKAKLKGGLTEEALAAIQKELKLM